MVSLVVAQCCQKSPTLLGDRERGTGVGSRESGVGSRESGVGERGAGEQRFDFAHRPGSRGEFIIIPYHLFPIP
ncbi:hypothetical protein [Spirulina subsalsa]|uniref:hypothetical protein n=1 Tax=Spirulina subsalsa TaxID=54311 RepID=UPI0002E454B8|nr:hypothetical protein [Spirulina subsalsa]